jgi:hypothetical protein
MSLFGSILEKLGIGGAAAGRQTTPARSSAGKSTGPATTGPATTGPAATAPPRTGSTANAPAGTGPAPAAPTPAPSATTPVDVSALLEKRAAASAQKLNWRTSIVDLLKLLEIDSSLEARKQLANELACPPELLNDSAKMNTWLHKAVLARVSANGGVVPKELLD